MENAEKTPKGNMTVNLPFFVIRLTRLSLSCYLGKFREKNNGLIFFISPLSNQCARTEFGLYFLTASDPSHFSFFLGNIRSPFKCSPLFIFSALFKNRKKH